MKRNWLDRLVELAIQQLETGVFDQKAFVAFLLQAKPNEAVGALNKLEKQLGRKRFDSISGNLAAKWIEDPTVDFRPFSWVDHLWNAPDWFIREQINALNSISPTERIEFETLIFLRNDKPESDVSWMSNDTAEELLELLYTK